jgi:beta-N-acetylhexosaminidase
LKKGSFLPNPGLKFGRDGLLLFSFLFSSAILFFPGTSSGKSRNRKPEKPRIQTGGLDGRILRFIRNRDFPGAVLLVRKGNRSLVNKGWGETFYGSRQRPDAEKSVYDLASVTKAVAISTTVMHLVELGKINENDVLSKHIPATRGFPLGNLTIEKLLAHKTGLPPYYFSNYWLLSKDLWDESTFSPVATPRFPDPYRGKFMPKGFRQIMLRDLCQLPFAGRNKTIYSDLNYILLGCLIEEVTGKRLDVFLNEWLFTPMGLKSICFNPLLNGISKERIVPTEENPSSHGWVYDDEAAKLAGICGAAGLFSNANDLAEIGDMLRHGGEWKGIKFLKTSTIKRFAWFVEPGHVRAMGWQKPAHGRRVKTIAPPKASLTSFGHTGFTGTLFWVDPKKDLTIIFLTNVTYPKEGRSTFKKNAGYKTVLKLVYDLL